MTDRATTAADINKPSWWTYSAGVLYVAIGSIPALGLWVVATDDVGIVGSVMWF